MTTKNQSLLSTNVDRYKGKRISHFESNDGVTLDRIHMCDSVVIVFDDGEKVVLKTDWRGAECYISQYTCKMEEVNGN